LENHNLIETIFAVAVGVGIAAFPVKNEDKDKK
jgi:hypothetical protein